MATGLIPRHVVITGTPGVGKTTLIKETCRLLASQEIPTQGFYTEENRNELGKRSGFDVVTLDGKRGPLARVKPSDGLPQTRREYVVGQYTVQLKEFESVALPSLKAQGTAVCVIDEIGRMELFSQSFSRAVQRLLDCSTSTVLCTIPIPKGKPIPGLVEHVRQRKDVVLYQISRENRDSIVQDIVKSVKDSYAQYSQQSLS